MSSRSARPEPASGLRPSIKLRERRRWARSGTGNPVRKRNDCFRDRDRGNQVRSADFLKRESRVAGASRPRRALGMTAHAEARPPPLGFVEPWPLTPSVRPVLREHEERTRNDCARMERDNLPPPEFDHLVGRACWRCVSPDRPRRSPDSSASESLLAAFSNGQSSRVWKGIDVRTFTCKPSTLARCGSVPIAGVIPSGSPAIWRQPCRSSRKAANGR